jgi:hypothetical protein
MIDAWRKNQDANLFFLNKVPDGALAILSRLLSGRTPAWT